MYICRICCSTIWVLLKSLLAAWLFHREQQQMMAHSPIDTPIHTTLAHTLCFIVRLKDTCWDGTLAPEPCRPMRRIHVQAPGLFVPYFMKIPNYSYVILESRTKCWTQLTLSSLQPWPLVGLKMHNLIQGFVDWFNIRRNNFTHTHQCYTVYMQTYILNPAQQAHRPREKEDSYSRTERSSIRASIQSRWRGGHCVYMADVSLKQRRIVQPIASHDLLVHEGQFQVQVISGVQWEWMLFSPTTTFLCNSSNKCALAI